MNSQFTIPEHQKPGFNPYSKEDFERRARNLKKEAQAVDCQFRLDTNISDDLVSNWGSLRACVDFQNKGRIAITKEFTFASAHALPFHEGKCKYLHGHEWKLLVTVEGAINEHGMVLDFSDLKRIVTKYAINQFDHGYINALLYNPTAENLCVYIWNVLQYDGGLRGIKEIKLYETPTSCAVLTNEQMVEGMWEWTL
jgi:6-pyruvoyltetrahydropterin/6-carboxytetrahydropterin synthase